MVEPGGAHIVLLEFVAAENDQFPRLEFAQHYVHKLAPERARTARNQNDLFRPVHLLFFLTDVIVHTRNCKIGAAWVECTVSITENSQMAAFLAAFWPSDSNEYA